MNRLSSTKNITFVIFLTVITISLFSFLMSSKYGEEGMPRAVEINSKTYSLEIADTPEKQALGLGERESLCQSCAMLFVFSDQDEYPFWMKGMRFPLDIVWLTGEKVVYIEKNVHSSSQEVLIPSITSNRVLEFNAGEVGDMEPGESIKYVY